MELWNRKWRLTLVVILGHTFQVKLQKLYTIILKPNPIHDGIKLF